MTTPVIFSLSSIPRFTDRRGGGDTLKRQMYYEKCILSILQLLLPTLAGLMILIWEQLPCFSSLVRSGLICLYYLVLI